MIVKCSVCTIVTDAHYQWLFSDKLPADVGYLTSVPRRQRSQQKNALSLDMKGTLSDNSGWHFWPLNPALLLKYNEVYPVVKILGLFWLIIFVRSCFRSINWLCDRWSFLYKSHNNFFPVPWIIWAFHSHFMTYLGSVLGEEKTWLAVCSFPIPLWWKKSWVVSKMPTNHFPQWPPKTDYVIDHWSIINIKTIPKTAKYAVSASWWLEGNMVMTTDLIISS